MKVCLYLRTIIIGDMLCNLIDIIIILSKSIRIIMTKTTKGEALIIMSVTIGVVLAVLFGFIRIGFKLAPWIVVAALAVWFFGGV